MGSSSTEGQLLGHSQGNSSKKRLASCTTPTTRLLIFPRPTMAVVDSSIICGKTLLTTNRNNSNNHLQVHGDRTTAAVAQITTTITTKTTVEIQSLRNASRDKNGPDPAKSDI